MFRMEDHMTRSVVFGAGACALALALATLSDGPATTHAAAADPGVVQGAAGEPYPGMPAIAPIGVGIGKYMDVPASGQGPAVDPAKGYRLQDLGGGLYLITDNAIQAMFLVYDRGVVLIDAPQSLVPHIPQA